MNEPSSLFRLDKRVAIVTGASSGLGRHFAEVLSAAGATVVVAARRRAHLEELADAVPNIVPVIADVTVEHEAQAVVNSALAVEGRIDVLVNNAGAVAVVPAEEEATEAFRQVIEVNLVAPFVLSRLVANHMLQRGEGSIINVSSILGLVGSGRIPQASYAASKGGLISMTRELAAQWSGRGIRVNALVPGWFPSEMTATMLGDERGRRFVERSAPMGRPGELTELGGALLFLAGPASSYVTGQLLVVDGGWTAI